MEGLTLRKDMRLEGGIPGVPELACATVTCASVVLAAACCSVAIRGLGSPNPEPPFWVCR
jgi:hypothetical protein